MATCPREVSKTERLYLSHQQLATDKKLVQALEDFAPVLQVLYHTMTNLVSVQGQDVEQISPAQQLKSLSIQASDLVLILLKYFGKLSQTRRRSV